MKTNTNFGMLVDGVITYAPSVLYTQTAIITLPTAADYAACGWLPVVTNNQPSGTVGVTYVPSGWEQVDGEIRRTWTAQPIVAPVRRWTPLSIKRACADKWPTVKTALQNADLYEEFLMAQYLASNDPSFVAGYDWAVSQYGAEAVNAILDAAEEA